MHERSAVARASDPCTATDLRHLAIELEERFPGIAPVAPLTVLGRGFRSLAVETTGGDVVRVGLTAEAADDYAKEWSIGRFLGSRLGSIVPEPVWYAKPGAGLPHGALGYRKLPGRTPTWGIDPGEAFACDLGRFMARLHGLPVAEARAAGIPNVDPYSRIAGARDVVMPVLSARLHAGDLARVRRWWEAFAADPRMRTSRIAVCHDDLWHDNLLHDAAGRLTGVLDIAHVGLSDPAHDFAAPRYFGDRFVDVVSAYRSAGGGFDGDDAYRAERFHEAREFGGLAWAIEHDDAEEIDDSVRKIVEGPIISRGAGRP